MRSAWLRSLWIAEALWPLSRSCEARREAPDLVLAKTIARDMRSRPIRLSSAERLRWRVVRTRNWSTSSIVVAGGAMSSRLWPQILAEVCGLSVEAVDCPAFTAYGAALHARETMLGPPESHRFPSTAAVRTHTPRHAREYRAWYQDCQKPMLDVQNR